MDKETKSYVAILKEKGVMNLGDSVSRDTGIFAGKGGMVKKTDVNTVFWYKILKIKILKII